MRRVLVVEDNPVNQFVALKQLKALGYSGSAVSSGSEAVKAVRIETFDVILMDCGLPEMDGYETARIIRSTEQNAQEKRVPIIAVTMDNASGALAKCLSAGMDAHVPKPASLTALRDALAQFMT